MSIEYLSGALFKSLKCSGIKLSLSLIITLVVMSSPVVMFINPTPSVTASLSSDGSTSAPSTIGQDGSDFTTQAAISTLTARPTNNIVNTKAFYDIKFVTATGGPIKKIQVVFPAGTIVPTSAGFIEAEGIGPGFVSTSDQVITYTVKNAVNIPAGTKIRLEFSELVNPVNLSSNYKVTVLTRDATNAVIDGPTQSIPYNLRQIGTRQIADDAITTPKIADGAVTTPKIADCPVTPSTITRGGGFTSVPAGTSSSDVVNCNADEEPTGGGFAVVEFQAEDDMLLTNFRKTVGGDGWIVEMFNTDSVSHPFEAQVTCLQPFP